LNYIVRSNNNRKSADEDKFLAQLIDAEPVKFTYQQEIREQEGKLRKATLSVRYRKVILRPPYRKGKKLVAQPVWIVEAKEENPPTDQAGLCWSLFTSIAIIRSSSS
jgi:hypothetical protein